MPCRPCLPMADRSRFSCTDRTFTSTPYPTDDELAVIEEAVCEMIRDAGRLVLERYEGVLHVDYKQDNRSDPVTEVDRAVEAYLTEAVAARFPGHAVLGEEGQDLDGAREYQWIVDPVDGTLNYVHRLPYYAISIGVLHRRRPVVGALHFPVTGELLHARRGGGARRNGDLIAVAKTKLGVGLSGLPPGFGAQFKVGSRARRRLGNPRSLGSIAYEIGLVATGAFQYAAFRGPKIWDVAGGVVLVHEAGGVALSYDRSSKRWARLGEFVAPVKKNGQARPLRAWGEPVIVGTPEIERLLVPHIVPRAVPRLVLARTRYEKWRKKGRSEKEADGSTPSGSTPAVASLPTRLRQAWTQWREG